LLLDDRPLGTNVSQITLGKDGRRYIQNTEFEHDFPTESESRGSLTLISPAV
jgi:hypothetical protein